MFAENVLVLVFLLILLISGVTRDKNRSRKRRKLVFYDEFDTLDLTIWRYDPNTKAHENEFQLYTSSSSNSYTEDGFLHIRPTIVIDLDTLNNSGNFHPIRSARLSTKNSFAFTYGTIEIRARVPVGDWLFPALWLMPKDSVYGVWPLSGEIDIMESRGNRNYTNSAKVQIGVNQISSTLHFGFDSTTDGWRYAQKLKNSDSYFSSDFHIYKLVWTPEKLTFYVDDDDMGSIEPPSGGFFQLGHFSSNATNPWSNGTNITPFDQDFYIIINLAVGGTHFFADNNINEGGKPWSNDASNPGLEFWNGRSQWLPTWDLNSNTSHFLVDYIRVYSL